ncbi:MAG: ABC transporter permease [Acholeplasmataceae bacterium]|nr:ABC transporter permease [Acholeplasmataceae bacterium]
MKLALSIAWRFLMSAKRQTLVIILGISVGVSVQVFIGSLITGLQEDLVDTTIGSSSHVTVYPDQDNLSFDDYDQVIQTIMTSKSKEELTVISPALDLGGILDVDGTKKEVFLRGFDFETSEKIYKIEDKLIQGTMPDAIDEVVLGEGLAKDLGVTVGDTLTIEIIGLTRTLTVSGIVDYGVAVLNDTWGVTKIETMHAIVGTNTHATSIEMQINDVFAAETIASELEVLFSDDSYVTTNWMSLNQELLSGLEGQSISSLMIQVFVIISVVLGIASVLAITVMQKSRQIGILKAMGITNRDASNVFLLEGFILGIGGAIGGIVLGLGLSYSFTTFALGPDGNPVVPLSIDPGFILLSAMIALVASTLAALIPAIKSKKMTVIEVIRNA